MCSKYSSIFFKFYSLSKNVREHNQKLVYKVNKNMTFQTLFKSFQDT